MFKFGLMRSVRCWGGGWRCYFQDGSCWFLTPGSKWLCQWGPVFGEKAWVVEARREEGLRAWCFTAESRLG